MDSKHPYTSHFSSLNKAAWQESQMQLSPSTAPNPQHNQINNVENDAKITTTPACDVSIRTTVEIITLSSLYDMYIFFLLS